MKADTLTLKARSQKHVRYVIPTFQGRQFLDQHAVECGLGVEVDVGERPFRGEAGEAEPAFEPSALDRLDFAVEQPLARKRV